MKAKSPTEERAIITRQPAKRPYGARVRVHLQTAASIGSPEGLCLLLDSGAFATFEVAGKAPWEGGDKYTLTLEGFATAAAAEGGGRKLVQALLWTAISMDFPLRLEYRTYEPTTVFDRTHSGGAFGTGFVTTGWPTERVMEELRESYSVLSEPDSAVLLSMEIFAGARVEIGERARFLAIVSALEPLAEERSLGPEVDSVIKSCVSLLDSSSSLEAPVRDSLRGRLQQLRKESIRQAILRVVRDALPNHKSARAIVDEAYALRSQIVHKGRPDDLDVDLEDFGRKIGGVLRQLYSARLGRRLHAPVQAG